MKIGIVGIGFMGMVHYLTYQKVKGAEVVALCETNDKRLAGDWTDIKGNFGPRGEQMDLSRLGTFSELDQMLAEEEIDAVDICLPPAMHADVAVRALEAGKHVFCEKPIALNPTDAEKMVAASEANDRLLLIGHVLPFFPEFSTARQLIDSGDYGKLLGGHFRRVISDPDWLPDFYKPDRIGGPMLDLHVHDAHFIRLLFGMPTGLVSQGRMRGEVAEYWNTQFRFADPTLVVSATSGVINQPTRGFLHGFEIHLEEATLAFEFFVARDQPTLATPFSVYKANGELEQPDLGSGDPMNAFEFELGEVARSLSAGEESPILSAQLARDAVIMCEKQTESIRSRHSVSI